ncbi:MAG: hypothetical protein IPK13_14215 [Deltaproteobacteria bacterium]|nr:hypothetical protein [Deltaproteobacteria bacterium]
MNDEREAPAERTRAADERSPRRGHRVNAVSSADMVDTGDMNDREDVLPSDPATFLWRWVLAEALGPPVAMRGRRRRL